MGLNKIMRYVHEVRKIVIPQLYLLYSGVFMVSDVGGTGP
jgi:hypothetical protein